MASNTSTDLDVRRLSGSLGAEVRGVALGRATADDAAAIRGLLLEHMVLFFPDQHLGERVVQRVTVMGDEPESAVPLPRWEPHGSKTATFWRDADMRRQLKAQRASEPSD